MTSGYKLRAQEVCWLLMGRWCSLRVVEPYTPVWCHLLLSQKGRRWAKETVLHGLKLTRNAPHKFQIQVFRKDTFNLGKMYERLFRELRADLLRRHYKAIVIDPHKAKADRGSDCSVKFCCRLNTNKERRANIHRRRKGILTLGAGTLNKVSNCLERNVLKLSFKS